ncbi:fimbria/pilus outer membrane usher protein [Delftia acidovorans]|uniref:Fimbria/pilus outer membrane usher protein n=1 Tax=Delftia acidovorans TaxID=80866 RepID=A0AAJ2R8I1_DELAC|nr:fimbria/pilus outer membrane usher protein [Delftia acidovorans]MDX4957082.1 fimbria/pilus outer membrane usher protein [Delftia acidovorans]
MPGPGQGPAGYFQLKPGHALLLSVLVCWQSEAQQGQQVKEVTTSTSTGQWQPTPAAVDFDPSFLNTGKQTIDVSRYSRANVVTAGSYNPDIYINGNWVGRSEVQFKALAGSQDALPCLDKALLEKVGIDLSRLPPEAALKLVADGGCNRLDQIIAGAFTSFDFGKQRLDLSVPQASLRRSVRGYVSPDQWSAGVPVGLLGYQFNTYHGRSSNAENTTQSYLGLNGGVNIDRWHFRHNGSFSWADTGRGNYQNISTYAQRDIADWSSQLILGDTYTGGDLMDSTSFRGIRLNSDDRMLPDSQRGYAPVVRGVANTNARVTITQNGIKLYETTVAPGAFVINDLYPTGYGGDLQVSITEANGAVRSFAVPYAAVPLSLREGQDRYSLTAGVVRHLPNTSPLFSQATWQHGFTNMLTGYGGVSVAKGHISPMIGAALTTPWGAFGADITHASTSIPNDGSFSGQSLRASYAKSFAQTGTHVAIAAYRYSTNGFFGLNDAMRARDQANLLRPSTDLYRPRNRASLVMGQQFGPGGGSLSLTASTAKYWNRQGSNVDYALGYSNSFRNISYNLSAARQRDAWGQSNTFLHVGLSIPLSMERGMMLSTNTNRDSRGRVQAQANLSGLLGDDNAISYGLSANHNTGGMNGSSTSASANATYRASQTELSGSVSASSGYQQFSVGARGAIVAHPGGVTLSQSVSDTFAIVEAKNAEGARINNAPGVKVDSRGYAVVPYLTPFSMNEVSIDPKGLSTDVELKETSQHVAPLAGAVPLLVFKTAYGRSAVIRARQAGNMPVPFGASVLDMDGKELGMIGQAGKLLARGLSDQGELQVQWKTDTGMVGCNLSYTLPERKRTTTYQPPQSLELPCVASSNLVPVMVAATSDPANAAMPAEVRNTATLSTQTVMAASAPPHSTPAPKATDSTSAMTMAGAQADTRARPSAQAAKVERAALERTLDGLRMSIRISALPSGNLAADNGDRSTPLQSKASSDSPIRGAKASRPIAVLQPSLKIRVLASADQT